MSSEALNTDITSHKLRSEIKLQEIRELQELLIRYSMLAFTAIASIILVSKANKADFYIAHSQSKT